ncbi:MAG: TauD/TfdA family dioxygenase [Proteobacteria bacterium]|nr:TauD/TfdA family dioxygenase [Pseudomonadota bacterium]
MSIAVRPLSHALGAEIQNVDLAQPLSNSEFDQIHRTFLEKGILLFRKQQITREQHIAFSRRFGELDRHDSLPRDRHPDYPELLLVTNIPEKDGTQSASKYTGQLWHSDLSFTLEPSLGSLLRGITIPPVGGDTMFTNMYMAYDTLSDGMKKMIEPLHGIHTGKRKLLDIHAEHEREQNKLNPPIAQPLVRVHPETGRKALYVGEKVSCLAGMTPEESKPIIDYLVRHATRPQFVYRHQWQQDDIILWDNRCTMHVALGDYADGEIRHLERTTVKGTPSGYYLQ